MEKKYPYLKIVCSILTIFCRRFTNGSQRITSRWSRIRFTIHLVHLWNNRRGCGNDEKKILFQTYVRIVNFVFSQLVIFVAEKRNIDRACNNDSGGRNHLFSPSIHRFERRRCEEFVFRDSLHRCVYRQRD